MPAAKNAGANVRTTTLILNPRSEKGSLWRSSFAMYPMTDAVQPIAIAMLKKYVLVLSPCKRCMQPETANTIRKMIVAARFGS